MAVVYWRSSSGALSFRSSVSMATTTRDTWLGLSGGANQKRAALVQSSQPSPTPFTSARLAVASPRAANQAVWFGWRGSQQPSSWMYD